MKNVPLYWGMLLMGRLCVRGVRGCMGNHCAFPSIALRKKEGREGGKPSKVMYLSRSEGSEYFF